MPFIRDWTEPPHCFMHHNSICVFLNLLAVWPFSIFHYLLNPSFWLFPCFLPSFLSFCASLPLTLVSHFYSPSLSAHLRVVSWHVCLYNNRVQLLGKFFRFTHPDPLLGYEILGVVKKSVRAPWLRVDISITEWAFRVMSMSLCISVDDVSVHFSAIQEWWISILLLIGSL